MTSVPEPTCGKSIWGAMITVSFPRSCVSDPRWVRLGFGSVRMESAANQYYGDDAQISGHLNANFKLSGRIRRG